MLYVEKCVLRNRNQKKAVNFSQTGNFLGMYSHRTVGQSFPERCYSLLQATVSVTLVSRRLSEPQVYLR